MFSREKRIVTESGTYTPIVVDFSRRDGVKRLEEIRRQIREGTFENWLELVFLPLYGKETGKLRKEIVENTIRFETELFKAKKISARLLAAALIMSNKMIDKDSLGKIWEEIKMLDILEIAHEKGKSMGKTLGIREGRALGILENSREMLFDALVEKFDIVPKAVVERIRTIEDVEILKVLFRKVFKCEDIEQFESILARY